MNGGKGSVPGPGEVIALLGRGSRFEGKLTFDGTVRIDGEFKGEIFSEDTLVIGQGADVHAEVEVGSLVLQGNLVGNVRATDVIDMRAPGRLEGNIAAPNIMIEKGVFFEGTCAMGPTGGRASGWAASPPPEPEAPPPPRSVAPRPPMAAPTLAPVVPHRSSNE
jgi:cytoskeletal protein CcmA (bactofilin family)